jgi:hypothetical protein
VLRSRRWNGAQKAMALIHLSSYLGHALMVLLLLLSLPLVFAPEAARFSLGGLGLMCLGPPLVYVLGQQRLYVNWQRRLLTLPLLVLLGIGVAWSNTRAVARGLTRWGGDFARPPKFRLEGQRGRWTDSSYRLRVNGDVVGEVALLLHALAAAGAAYVTGNREMIPFLLLYAAAFGLVSALGMWQTGMPWWRRRSRRSRSSWVDSKV